MRNVYLKRGEKKRVRTGLKFQILAYNPLVYKSHLWGNIWDKE